MLVVMNKTILLVGCGKMGFAMLRGWQSAKGGFSIHVVDGKEEMRARALECGIPAYTDVAALDSSFSPDGIVLAVEPGSITHVLGECRRWKDTDAAIVSVAAGVRLEDMSAVLPSTSMSLIRVMPNIPAVIGEGITVCCADTRASKASRTLTTRLLEGIGEVAWIDDEEQMDAVTAVSGCGPAYMFAFIEALVRAGVAAELSENLSRRLALVTAAGSSRMALGSDETAEELRRRVATPGGATAAAMKVLLEGGRLDGLLRESVEAAKKRSKELGEDS